jgi:hypothetical protein
MNKTTKQMFDFINETEYCYFKHYQLRHEQWHEVKGFNNYEIKYSNDFDEKYHEVKDLSSDHLRCFTGDREFTILSHNKIEVTIYQKDFMDRRSWSHKITVKVPPSFVKPYIIREIERHSVRLENEEEELRRKNRREEIFNNLIKRD